MMGEMPISCISGIGGKWGKMTESQRKAVILRMLDQVELCNRTQRLKGLRAVLYLTQGVFDECECEEAQQYWQRQNCFLLYEMGVFEVFLELLSMETTIVARQRQRFGSRPCR